MPMKNDLVGRKFGRLVAIRASGKKNGAFVWECMCDCGNTAYIDGRKLKNGHTKSCGCIRKDGTKKPAYSHGQHKTRLYRIWSNMKTRCGNRHSDNYKFYGGKGIKICKEWLHNFKSFYEWAMENGYKDGLTIDRIDSNCDYSPKNCQWVTQSENAKRANDKRWAARACEK